MKKSSEFKGTRAKKVDIGIKNILHLAELIQLSHYVGHSLKGFLKYLYVQVNHIDDPELQAALSENLERINGPLNKLLSVVFKLHQYTSVDVDSVVNFPRLSTLNKAMNYFESGRLENKYIIALWEELLDLFIKVINSERRLANFQKISILELGTRLIGSVHKLHQKYPKKDDSFPFYLHEKGLLTEKQFNELQGIRKQQKKTFQETLKQQDFFPNSLIEKEWSILELFSLQDFWSETEKQKYFSEGELSNVLMEELQTELGNIHNALSNNEVFQEKIFILPQLKPFHQMLKVAYCHKEIFPASLWSELLERGLFANADNFYDLNKFLRQTKYLQRKLDKQQIGSAGVKKLCTIIEEEAFLQEMDLNQIDNAVFDDMANNLFGDDSPPQEVGSSTEMRGAPEDHAFTGIREESFEPEKEEVGSFTEMRPDLPSHEMVGSFTEIRTISPPGKRGKDSIPPTGKSSPSADSSDAPKKVASDSPSFHQMRQHLSKSQLNNNYEKPEKPEDTPAPSLTGAQKKELGQTSARKSPVTTRRKSLQVLLIDDDPFFCKMISAMLLNVYDVICINDPTQAIRELPHLNPDVLLLDYDMPQMNGLDVLTIIKKRKANLPVIMVTGHRSMELGVKAIRIGAFDCINKPFSLETLIDKITEATHDENSKSSWTCKGKLESTPLIEVLQICSTVQHSGTLTIETEDETMAIFFQNGNVVDARCGPCNGFKALLRIALMQKGEFLFVTSESVDCEKTIEADTSFLLLELTRQCDEYQMLREYFTDFSERVIPSFEVDDPILARFIVPLPIQALLDSEEASDYEILSHLVNLLENGLLLREQDQHAYVEESEHVEEGEYSEEGEHVEEGEHSEEEEYSEGQHAEEDEYSEEGQHAEEGEYSKEGQHAEEGEYSEEDEYSEEGEHAEEKECTEQENQENSLAENSENLKSGIDDFMAQLDGILPDDTPGEDEKISSGEDTPG